MGPTDVADWENFLSENGCHNIVDYGEWIMCNCIFHEQSELARPSLGVHKDSGGANCLSCGYHSWSDLCEAFGISDVEFIEGVRESIWEGFKKRVARKKESQKFLRYKLPDGLANPLGHKGAKEYLIDSKGFDKSLLEEFGVRVCLDERSKYFEYIIFPIRDEKGVLYFDARYAGKNPANPRWRRPKSCAHWKTYFNFENVKDSKALVFVEGVADALKLIQFGLPAIPAKTFSPHQMRTIFNSKAEYFFLAYDEDPAGRYHMDKHGKPNHYTAKALALLEGSGSSVDVVKFPKYANDPADIQTASELFSLNPKLANFIL